MDVHVNPMQVSILSWPGI